MPMPASEVSPAPRFPFPASYRGDSFCKARLISLSTPLPLAERDTLEPLSRRVSLDRKETLFWQDEPAGSVFNVTSGALRLYRILTDGRRQVTGFAFPGDFLGLSLLDQFCVSADALCAVTVCGFERLAFRDMVRGHPSLLMHLHEISGRELSQAVDMMMLLGRRTAEERVASFLTELQTRYARIGYKSPTLELPMGRLDIADHLGLTIETVSRTLSHLDRDGSILIVPGGVRIVNQARLDHLSAN